MSQMDTFKVAGHDTHPIRRARKARHLSMEAFGSRVGVTKATVSKWERGDAFPEPSTAFKVSKVLRLSLEQVYAAAKGEKAA